MLPFELEDRRNLSPASVGLAFLPFSLGVGLLSQFFGGLADSFGAPRKLVAGALGASVAYIWMALGQGSALIPGVVVPQALLGISFAVLVAPLTASVLSSVTSSDEGLASGINNAISRVAQLGGVAIAAGIGTVHSRRALGGWRPDDGGRSTTVALRLHLPLDARCGRKRLRCRLAHSPALYCARCCSCNFVGTFWKGDRRPTGAGRLRLGMDFYGCLRGAIAMDPARTQHPLCYPWFWGQGPAPP
jgi:hypothetical protein